MGGATALYSGTCFARGKYENGSSYPVALRAIVGLSGWLPGARFTLYALAILKLNFWSC